MAEESLIEGDDENILYDLLVITEWPPETDTQVSESFVYTRVQLHVCLFYCAYFCKNVSLKSTLSAPSVKAT